MIRELETAVLGGHGHGEVRECANAKVCELGRGTERAERREELRECESARVLKLVKEIETTKNVAQHSRNQTVFLTGYYCFRNYLSQRVTENTESKTSEISVTL